MSKSIIAKEGEPFKTITLRNIPEKLMDQIESRSRESGLGLSRTVIDMLLGKAVASELALHHEFDFLFGSMSK